MDKSNNFSLKHCWGLSDYFQVSKTFPAVFKSWAKKISDCQNVSQTLIAIVPCKLFWTPFQDYIKLSKDILDGWLKTVHHKGDVASRTENQKKPDNFSNFKSVVCELHGINL